MGLDRAAPWSTIAASIWKGMRSYKSWMWSAKTVDTEMPSSHPTWPTRFSVSCSTPDSVSCNSWDLLIDPGTSSLYCGCPVWATPGWISQRLLPGMVGSSKGPMGRHNRPAPHKTGSNSNPFRAVLDLNCHPFPRRARRSLSRLRRRQ